MLSINDTDRQVAQFLKANNIKFTAQFLGLMPASKNWDREHLAFNIMINNEQFEYKAGIGHIVKVDNKLSPQQSATVKELRELLDVDKALFAIIERSKYAALPTQASVLYCLLSDASCADGYNFNDFCSNFGYDTDSISAFKTYQVCCDTLDKMHTVFSRKQIEQLQELLQDY